MQQEFIHSFRYLILLLMCGLALCSSSAAQEMPPIKKGTDTAAINKILNTAKHLADPDSALQQFEWAARASMEGNYYLGVARALIAAGSKYSDRGNYEKAIAYGTKALPYAERSGNKSQIAFCHNLFGTVNFMQGNYVKASEEFYLALEGLKNTGNTNKDAIITIYTNLASLSGRLGQNDKKLYYLTESERIARNSNTSGYLLGGILINKGNYYSETIPDSAIKYYMEVLAIAEKMDVKMIDKKNRMQALAEINLAGVYVKTGEYEKAINTCRHGISLIKNKYAYIAIAGNYTLGDALRHLKKYTEAEAVTAAALKESANANLRDQAVQGYVTLANIYKDSKQYQKALDAMDTLIALKDTIMTAEKVKAINQVEAKYNMADKDARITRNELMITQQQNKINRKNLLISSISATVILLAALSFVIYRHSRQKQTAIIKSLKQENTISILKGVVQGEENERIRLARDLHDGIGGMLSATKMRFMALRHDNDDLVRSPRYLEAMDLLDTMGDEIRKTSHNLMPEVLLKQDLAEALRSYCNNIQAGTSLHIDFQSFGSFNELPNDFKLNIYRIIQELLKNILQHAQATYVVVQLMMMEAYMTISVEDNGIGFDTSETKDGIGLHNLKTRILSQEGHYTLKSEKGKGTMVYIEFEIPANARNKSV